MEQRMGESVLVPAPFGPHGLTCVRSLGRRGVRTVVAAEREGDPTSTSRYCHESIVVPSPHEDILAYKNALLGIAAREDVRAIVPNREEDVYVLSKFRDEFATHVSPLWPSFETLRTAHDRVRLVEAAEEAGVAVPETLLLDDVDVSDPELFVKPRYPILITDYESGYSPTECDPRNRTMHLRSGERADRDTVVDEMNHVPIAQEFVRGGGEEYAFFALYDRGEPVATFQHRQVRGETYAGGASVYRESVDIPGLRNAGRALFDHLDWHGVGEAEFLRDPRTGEFKLIEVNPRMWASLSCAVAAGADFPYYYWQLANGETANVDGYATGTGTHTLFGELKYLSSVTVGDYPHAQRPSLGTAVREVLASCYDQPRFEYLRPDDPRPFVRGVLDVLVGDR
jgi:predicted ATP-grasp superfamily ATP-dependent carboligase